jgi:glycosyltransferase involved in cell wall biosynthesis
MRIAYLLPAPGIPVQGPSGSSAHVRGMVAALAEGHDVRLYAARRSDHRGVYGYDTEAIELGVPGWPSWLKEHREMREVLAARRIARRVIEDALGGWVPDLVIERHTLFSDAGWRVHDRLGVPWVLEVNAPAFEERSRFEEILRKDWAWKWERRVLQAAPKVVAVSKWLVRWLEDDVGCRNVGWVPNGVEPFKGDPIRGRRLLGVDPEIPVIGFVGSMKTWHGVDRLHAIANAVKAQLVLVGRTSQELPEGVISTGHLAPEDMADVISAMNVGMAPYPQGAPDWFCPLKVLEYRAQGVPVVATDVGDTKTLVEKAGVVVRPGNDPAIVEAVRRMLGWRCKPRVRTWGTVADEILEFAGFAQGDEDTEERKRRSDGSRGRERAAGIALSRPRTLRSRG